jgi:hypothetical protein
MWTPTNQEFFRVIIDELRSQPKPVRYGDLWWALKDKFGSKATFNLYLRKLVEQGIVKRVAHRRLPDGRWITVRRSRTVKYDLAKTSPLSAEAPTDRIREWIETNFLKSRISFLIAVQHCLKGDLHWKFDFSEFEKTMTLNMRMWSDVGRRQDFYVAVRDILSKIEDEIKELRTQLEVSARPKA